MAMLRLILRHGFQDDTVVLRVDGREVFRKSGVRTRMQIDQADSIEIEESKPAVEVEILLPAKNLQRSIQVSTAKPVALAFSLSSQGEIEHSFPDPSHGDL